VTAVAPGIDRGRDRRDAPRDPGQPEPDTTPRDAARWAALPDALRAQVTGFARAAAGDTKWVTHTIYPDRRRPADEGREP
jgi:hypothetical protein